MAAPSPLDPPDGEDEELSNDQKIAIAKWFLRNSPPGEINYVAKDLQAVLTNEDIFRTAAKEAYAEYNKEQMISLEMPDRSGQVLVTQYGEIDADHYVDLRTAQVATVDHVKQVCTGVRPAVDDELPCVDVEEYRAAIDVELLRYVEEAFPKGDCAVYATAGKDVNDVQAFELIAVISSAKFRPQNFCNGRWRSVWVIHMHSDTQTVELKGNIRVSAHYFEEGNVQLDTSHECKDSTIFQNASETGLAIANIIQYHESEYLSSLEDSYSKLSDNTFKELRRKLPVTRTLFPWGSAHQLSLTRELSREMSMK